MKILKRALLLSFISVLVVSQGFGENNKKSVDQTSDLTATSSEVDKGKFNDSNPNSISEKLNASSVNQHTQAHLKSNSKGVEIKAADRDYLTEIKDSLHKIFDLCLIIGGIALIFIILKILYSISKYIDSLTTKCGRKKPANNKPIEEIKG